MILGLFLCLFVPAVFGKFRTYAKSPKVIDQTSLAQRGWNFVNFTDPTIYQDPDVHYRFFVAIKSRAEKDERRNLIRKTLLANPVFGTKCVPRFYVGLNEDVNHDNLKAEIAEHGDVVVFDIYDDYHHISTKTMGVREYALERFSFDFYLEIDDDIYINMNHVFETVRDLDPELHYYIGDMFEYTSVERNPGHGKGRHYVSYDDYPYDTYPPWANGPALILSHGLLDRMFEKKPFSYLEIIDMGTGLLAASVGNVKYIEPEAWILLFRTGFGGDTYQRWRIVKEKVNAIHYIYDEEMEWLYAQEALNGEVNGLEFIRVFGLEDVNH